MQEPSLPSDPRDYILDLSTSPSDSPLPPHSDSPSPSPPRIPHISIHFRCCKVYAPIYRTADATAYAGHCPKCLRPTRIPISPTGTTTRIFEAS